MDQALAASTLRDQDSAAADLRDWLTSLGEGVDLGNVGPEFLLVYLEEEWLPSHPGRKRGRAGPKAVAGVLSSLSGWFERFGRAGPYQPATGVGNPCNCQWVSDYRKGYRRGGMLEGYEEVSAVPLTPEKYKRLCVYLFQRYLGEPGVVAGLVLLRDLLCSQYMWQSTMRGHDTGKLGLADFCDPDRPGAVDTRLPLPPPWSWPAGRQYRLCVRERGTKTSRTRRADPVFLEPNPGRPELCFPRTLALYMWRSAQPGAPGCAVRSWLFRPLTSDRRGFKEEPLSSSALGARIRRHLRDADLYAGETSHSFRRGALQAAAAEGVGTAGLMGLGQIRSPAILARYLDPHRHGARQVV
ncbi:hypothetical protein GPECTOR_54g172 [Gonium pectorale]|uniref:Tyr recombinase domain-containing protein n=1 Tax=Gonium pectorale TaxID=33097 RepID=A0A150G6G2_GONPE|nr:hypothetical protein GPECTOR_54g172 [Gonium pectorale]|eukprot:KXZ45432.1 hypothetical protein GPECTOR_54g172 [Gonium pectorale]